MELVSIIIIGVAAVAAVVAVVLGINSKNQSQSAKQQIRVAEESARRIVEEAQKQAETKRREAALEAKDELHRLKTEAERETRRRQDELVSLEKRLVAREESLDQKEKSLEKHETDIQRLKSDLAEQKTRLEEARQEQNKVLERVAGMSQEDAKAMLLKNLENEVAHHAGQIIKKAEDNARKEAEKRCREIVATTLQRVSTDHVPEITTTIVPLPSDDIKGRIIGREGRNIRAFENTTGVDLVVDDTPESVMLSCFEPIRREIARLTLEKLIADGRIHPARIEEMHERATKELNAAILEHGEKAALSADVQNLAPPIIQLLGRLKYRTSYGQSVLSNCVEAARIAGLLASELGANPKLARRGALLHDIGKAIDRETEGTHIELGARFVEKAGEPPEVVHCIEAHHGDIPVQTVEAAIVMIADAVSSARPGARRDSLEQYVKRLQALEAVAKSFDGVDRVFAIQAGREIRVIVTPDKVDDILAAKLAYDIARKIEKELDYPGEVKVTVIRETRTVETAK